MSTIKDLRETLLIVVESIQVVEDCSMENSNDYRVKDFRP